MIRGIGIDIEEIARFRNPAPHLIERILSEDDRRYLARFADPAPHLAGIWAAKEALVKATGLTDLTFNRIAVIHEPNGKPYLSFRPDVGTLHLSISHSAGVAVAVVIWDDDPPAREDT